MASRTKSRLSLQRASHDAVFAPADFQRLGATSLSSEATSHSLDGARDKKNIIRANSGNVFCDLGFDVAEAQDETADALIDHEKAIGAQKLVETPSQGTSDSDAS